MLSEFNRAFASESLRPTIRSRLSLGSPKLKMPAARSTLAATHEHSATIFSDFKSHCDGKRTDTKTTILTLLRSAYEDYHVTEVEAKKIALFEYAATNKALLNLDSDDEQFNATRDWHAIGQGIEKKMHPGSVSDDFRFARSVLPFLMPAMIQY